MNRRARYRAFKCRQGIHRFTDYGEPCPDCHRHVHYVYVIVDGQYEQRGIKSFDGR